MNWNTLAQLGVAPFFDTLGRQNSQPGYTEQQLAAMQSQYVKEWDNALLQQQYAVEHQELTPFWKDYYAALEELNKEFPGPKEW